MNLRLAWGTAALLWMGCGGAFTTTIDPNTDAGSTTGGAGTTTTGAGGDVGEGGSTGVGGSSSGVGGSTTGVGGSSTGAGGSSAGSGGSVGMGGAGGSRGPDWTACDGPGQCIALETSCCGSCGSADVSAYAGVNTKRVDDFNSQKCPLPVACPAIACLPAMNQNIAARCVAGHCQAFDVRKVPEYSACMGDTDCHLRAGLGCCICGAANAGWVALNKSGEQGISDAECAPNTGCLDCLPVPPPRTLAACTNHVCQVLLAP
jgi:hypothetical protein